MSRIGKLPIQIPSGVTVSVQPTAVEVKGPKGRLAADLVRLVDVAVADGQVIVNRANDSQQARANHGLMRSLVNNMVTGVSTGFEKRLEVNGVGYRAEVRGKQLVMQLGFSHPVEYPIPEGIEIAVEKNTKVSVRGADKQKVGQVAAVIRGFRPPDHYKGKGVRYEGEYVRLKAGKSA